MPEKLKKTLNSRDLTFIVIGTVIGSGIFMVPGVALRQSEGFVGIALAVWLFGGILSFLGAMTYAELGSMMPKAGGLYIYLRDAFGSLTAFLYGWATFFIIGTATIATLAVAFSSYLNQIIPLTPIWQNVVSVLMILVVAAINVKGTRESSDVLNWTTAIKAGAVIIMSILLLILSRGVQFSSMNFFPESITPSLLSGIGLALVGVLWAYEGWHYVTFSTGEAIDPQKTFAKGLLTGTIVLILIYMLANLAYISALGPAAASQSESIAADAVNRVINPAAGKIIAVAILISMFSAANGITLTSTRVYYAMAQDGVFFQKLGEVHPRFGTPAFAVIFSSLISIIYAVSGTFEQLLTYVVFTGWIFYALAAMTIFIYRRRLPEAKRPFKVPGYPVTPALFILATAGIVLNTLYTQPGRAALGMVIVLAGTPAFYFWKSRK